MFVNKSSNVNFVKVKRFLNFLLLMKATIDRLQNKLERLVSKHQEVKSANLQLKQKLLSLQERLDKEQAKCFGIERQKQNLEAFGIFARRRAGYASSKTTN